MQAAIAISSISPYMCSVSGPMLTVPVCGEGIEARITVPIFPDAAARLRMEASEPSDQDLEGDVRRAAGLDQVDREVQVDVVPGRQLRRVSRRETGALELGAAPVLDSLYLALLGGADVCRRH